MAFCQNCGAQMSGEFCTACGSRAKTADPVVSPAGPAAAMPPAATGTRKTSPLVWIMVAVLGIFVLFGIAVVSGGLFLVHKAKQAGFDSELMRNNPGLATAKLLAATNPDLEVVSSDDRRGLITLRQKSSGKTVTVNFEDIKRGKFSFSENGKDAVTMEAHGEGDSATFQMKSGSETMTMGANQAKLPSWIPSYPASKPAGIFSMNGKEGKSASFAFQTQDAPKDVVAYYERELKHNGFHIEASTATDSGASSGGMLSADDQANRRKVLVTVGNDNKGTNVSVTYEQK